MIIGQYLLLELKLDLFSLIIRLKLMEARTKAAHILWEFPTTCVMTQTSEMNNYGKVNMYSIPRDARALSWTQTTKWPI